MTTPTFEDATPVKRTGGAGRTKEFNPYLDIVKQIANQKNEETGDPLAKSFLVNAVGQDGDDNDKALKKVYRQLSQAGFDAMSEPPVSVMRYLDTEPKDDKGKAIKGKYRITFWTGPQQKRERKDKTVEVVGDTKSE